ncbi:MAG: carbamate kinase [Alphaproteobacteria bacterium]|jgi:carbamate kinase|nr:carbamate kinase [Alphaproteobacteria bacterium]MDP6567020.1 carbamate kinase [Alphaproteobacteria bacterium]MDP6812199.1 carbamate kinase [Alphaproteobacteria bacterium]
MSDQPPGETGRPIVVALGGNALMQPGQPLTMAGQRRNAGRAAAAIAGLCGDHDVIVTHGNGPQVGALALQSQAAAVLPDQTLDVLAAESEGMIGYVLEQELYDRLPNRKIATLLTLVVVDPEDPAMTTPSKPVGPWYEAHEWRPLAEANGWSAIEDGGQYRRVVPSPEPRDILELPAIEALVRAGIVPICAGGGGIAVAHGASGELAGVEGIVDKDLTSALLAVRLDAACLLLLTDVDAVYEGWGGEAPRALASLDRAAAASLDLAAGSMAPKVEAALRFAEATGRPALIGNLEDATAMLAGKVGTRLTARRQKTAKPRRL